jgi:hypothetical protein
MSKLLSLLDCTAFAQVHQDFGQQKKAESHGTKFLFLSECNYHHRNNKKMNAEEGCSPLSLKLLNTMRQPK